MSLGATVWCTVAKDCIGLLLHHLESRADIHLLDRRMDQEEIATERWTLRGERFPSSWEGKRVSFTVFRNTDLRIQCVSG